MYRVHVYCVCLISWYMYLNCKCILF